MKITFKSSATAKHHAAIPVFSDGAQGGGYSLYGGDSALENAALHSGASKKAGKSAVLFPAAGPKTLTLLGVGARKDFNAETFAAKAARQVKAAQSDKLCLHLEGTGASAEAVAAAAGAARLAAYRFDLYKTKGEKSVEPLDHVEICCDDPKAAQSHFDNFYGPVSEGTVLARDLVMEPPNVLNPVNYAERIKALKEHGLSIEVLGEKQMAKLGMNALLGVGIGSEIESQMVIMKWMGGKKSDAPVCLVGKGVTFDTGGISLKPGDKMWDMKGDMGGSAAVVGAMMALAARKAKANVIGLVGLVENMPDGKAQRPGDIVTSMSGQTIEVQNTDAEGRLVLCDVLHYANVTFKPKAMVDLATLTGAIIISLGHEHAGLFSDHDDIANGLLAAGQSSAETVWRLPLGKAYDELLESKYADMKNIGGRAAGSITAAQFLKRFVGDTPWAHLDIAGTAWKDSSKRDQEPAWATGFGVRLLNQWVKDSFEAH